MSTVKSKKLQVGTDASASNNFTIYQPATPDGTLRIGVGNADSPTEVGQFNANGYKPAANSVPTTRVYLNSDSNMGGSTWTKCPIDVEEYDLTSDFDSSTNYRFTPSVAGYYQVNARVRFNSSGTRTFDLCGIYKNGGLYTYGVLSLASTTSDVGVTISDIIYLNGSTDYIELYGFSVGTGIYMQGGTTYNCWMSATLIQQA